MIIVRIMAGLGNQMFQYALIKALEKEGKDVYADTFWFDKFCGHNGLEIEKIFPITLRKTTKSDANRLGYADYTFWQRLCQKYFPKTTYIKQGIEDSIVFQPQIFDMDDVYLSGYWQSEKFFSNVSTEICDLYGSLKKSQCSQYDEKILHVESVSIHIRRGDYVNNSVHGNVCSMDYYTRAVEYMTDKLHHPKFFVFSDDISWCRDNLHLMDAVYVDENQGSNSYLDMRLMSMCKHNIIANSSFSWWAAYLNDYSSKIVVAPDRWFSAGCCDTGDLIPESWVRLPVE
ncbi:MAG: alpha-1,2-fucosyltransferase [Anaerovibrio sp.]